MTDNRDFFEKQTSSSRIKATIVSDYFVKYCKIISRRHMPKKFGYFDMFAGPGIYKDGSWSTPLLVAEKCQKEQFLKDRVWMVFNDKEYGDILKENFETFFPLGTFKYKNHFRSRTFGECLEIDQFLQRGTEEGVYNECPTLLFIDPFGYKHINTSVLCQFLRHWGNEVFIFVNTKRINAAFENEKFQEDLKIIFPSSYQTLKDNKRLMSGPVEERHKFIIDNLGQEFNQILDKVYFTSFEFREENQETPSHYLLHITKGLKGFDLVKQIFSQYANEPRILNGFATYTYNPKTICDANIFAEDIKQENLEIIKRNLISKYSNKTIDAETLFNNEHGDNLYARSHYTLALRQLYDEKCINVEYNDGIKHRVSVLLSKKCIITFK